VSEVVVDGERLAAGIEDPALISDSAYPSVTRVLFTETDLRARRWLTERMEAAGLDVRIDAVGNVVGRWAGDDPGAAPVATGSLIDAIPDACRFDGVVGVLGAWRRYAPPCVWRTAPTTTASSWRGSARRP
jgi:ureidoglycolate amidohydrolase